MSHQKGPTRAEAEWVRDALTNIGIRRITADRMESFGVIPPNEGDRWFAALVQHGFLRRISEVDSATTLLRTEGEEPHDLVLKDNSVEAQNPRTKQRPRRPKPSITTPRTTVPATDPHWHAHVARAWSWNYSASDWVYVVTKGRMFYALALSKLAPQYLPAQITKNQIDLAIKKLAKDMRTVKDHVTRAKNAGIAYRWIRPPSAEATQLLNKLLATAT